MCAEKMIKCPDTGSRVCSGSGKAFSAIGQVVLASGSPARLQLLKDMGIKVSVCKTDADEEHQETEPGAVVQLLARRKMEAFMAAHPGFSLNALTCDTLISFHGTLIGKPVDEADARRQLRMFSGQPHQVYSGYCLFYRNRFFEGFDVADVVFRQLSPEEIESYLVSGEYRGAAGSYRIQGLAKAFISEIHGDIDTVIGMPTEVLGKIVTSQS